MIDLDRLPYISNYKWLLYRFIMCIIRIISLAVIQSLQGKRYYFYEYYYFVVSFNRKCLKKCEKSSLRNFFGLIGRSDMLFLERMLNLDRNKKFWKRWIVFVVNPWNWKAYAWNTYVYFLNNEMAEWYICNLCEQTGTSWQLVANFSTVIGVSGV